MSESTNQNIDDGGSAFPAMLPGGNYCTTGMSLRDWFAGQAMAAFCTHEALSEAWTIREAAVECYLLADAMLNAREKT